MNAAQGRRPGRVLLADLKELPVMARHTDARMVNMVAEWARSNPAWIGPIGVAQVKSELYIINDYETVEGLRRAGVSAWRARMSGLETVGAAVEEHVRANFFARTIDPLKMHGAAAYLEDAGMRGYGTYDVLEMYCGPELAGALRRTAGDALRELQGMMGEICEKTHPGAIPLYYVTMLSGVRDRQHEAARELRALTLYKVGCSAGFSWLSAEAVRMALRRYRKGARTDGRPRRPGGASRAGGDAGAGNARRAGRGRVSAPADRSRLSGAGNGRAPARRL